MALRRVFEPISIGKVEIPNRIVRTAHVSNMSDGYLGDQGIAYHEARARGGCGLSILEAAQVHHSGGHPGMANVMTDDVIPSFHNLMNAVRPHGMRVFQQLWHGGHVSFGSNGAPASVVSTIPGERTGMGIAPVGVVMDRDEIKGIVQAFADAAVRCQEGGLDGVELHAAHGYLFYQFLTPSLNTRTDEYGGTLENRMRFLMEVYRGVRLAVGKDFVVGARFSAGGHVGGTSPEDVRVCLDALTREGLDYVAMGNGDYFRTEMQVAGMEFPTGYGLPLARPFLANAKIPRIVSGRYRTLEEAEQALADGEGDLVGMVRAHIADPGLVRKALAGEEARPCIGCNQGCVGGAIAFGRLGCTVNPIIGHEKLSSEDAIMKTAEPKRVLVVGGGPAGMEAARVSALQGHKVVLAEGSPKLGGAVNVAKRAPRQMSYGDITDWLEREIFRIGVEVNMNTYIDLADVQAERPDIVLVATGSSPRLDGVQLPNPGEPALGVAQPHVLSSTDVLMAKPPKKGTSAVVVDTVGHFEAVGVALHLIHHGVAVTFITHYASFAPTVQHTIRDTSALAELYEGDFAVYLRHNLVEVKADTAVIRESDGKRLREVKADIVVLVSPNEPNRSLYEELKAARIPVVAVGDALAPRDLQAAIASGHWAARELEKHCKG